MLRLAGVGALAQFAIGCGGGAVSSNAATPSSAPGTPAREGESRLTARPGLANLTGEVRTGLQPLGLGHDEDALVYVPKGYTHQRAAPLAVLLHGAGGFARGGIELFLSDADAVGVVLLAITSREATWDLARSGAFGADVAFLDRALQLVFARFAIDPARVAIAGFSDGASYALSLGLTNGDLFTAIMAFSPGFFAPAEPVGLPRIFIAHGTQDIVLPIDQTSRLFAPQLREAGYAVEFVEFDGLHMVPDDVVADALEWWLGDG